MGPEIKPGLSRAAFRCYFGLAGTVLIILIVATVIDYIAYKHNLRLNLTERKNYSLSERSRNILKGLKQKVIVTCFYPRDLPETDLMRKLLGYYADISPFFEFRMLDTLRNPMEMQRYGVQHMDKVTVVESAGKRAVIQVASETDLTNAIIRVTASEKKTIYFLMSGEGGLAGDGYKRYSKARNALEEEGYAVKRLDWEKTKKYIPPGTSLLTVCSLDKGFGDMDVGLMDNFINQGGKILFLLDPFVPGLDRFLAKYHVIIKNDIVVDEKSMLVGGDMFIPLIDPKKCGKHSIVSHIESPIGLPLVRSVEPGDPVPKNMSVESLLVTNPGTWTIPKSSYDKWEFDFVDGKGKIGPVSVAVAVNTFPAGKGGKIVVIGDSDFANDSYIDLFGGGNRDLFLNSVEWLVEGEGFVSQRPRVYQYEYVGLSEEKRKVLLFAVVLLPCFVFVSGMIIYLRNKRMRL